MKNTTLQRIIEIDASEQIVGRVASKIAGLLQDKHTPFFEPRLQGKTIVKVTNANKVKFTGKKMEQKKYYKHTGYLGHLKILTAEKILARDPERILRTAVYRMLPKNKLRAKRIKRLVFIEQ